MSKGNDGDGKVGYGRPPKSGQFPKGKSGNPNGRPRRDLRAISDRQIRADIIGALEEDITIVHKGKTKKISRFEAILSQLISLALKGGNFKAIKLLVELYTNTVKKHELLHPDSYKTLEQLERQLMTFHTGKLGPDIKMARNNLRQRTKPK